MKLDTAINEVQDAEVALASKLSEIGERHAAEHDLYHLSHTLVRQGADHLRRLVPFGDSYGTAVRPHRIGDSPGMLASVRHTASDVTGRSESSGLPLLRDLRQLYLVAQEAELAWLILAQAARAVRDHELLQVATSCQEDAEARGTWLRTRIKETAPQALATG